MYQENKQNLSIESEVNYNENPIIWPKMTDLEKQIITDWATDVDSINLLNLIKVLHKKLNECDGISFNDKLLNMDFTKPNGNLFENIMAQILTVSYCKMLDVEKVDEKKLNTKLVELWNNFKSYYMQI